LVIGIAGYGNVARGAGEVLAELSSHGVPPENLAAAIADGRHPVIQTTFREEHTVRPSDPDAGFDLSHYLAHPADHRSIFADHLPHLHILVNCIYWDSRYPRLISKDDLRRLYSEPEPPRLRVIGDIGCDIDGAVEATVAIGDPGDPVYVWQPESDTAARGVEGHGPVILAVDLLPAELPLEASVEFSDALASFLPCIARADFSQPFDALDLPPEIRRAVIVHRGNLTENYSHLAAHLPP
jgi:alpha-aminoadipic semialdehyde synthase